MVELPMIDGHFYQVCNTCPAKVWHEGKYYCDPSKFVSPSELVKVARVRPMNCPQPSTEGSSINAYALLRSRLQK